MKETKLFTTILISFFLIPFSLAQKDNRPIPVLSLDAKRMWKHYFPHRFDFNILTWFDFSPSRLIATLEGGFTEGNKKFWQEKPARLHFNGIDEYVNLGPAKELKMSEAFSIEVWFRPNNLGGDPENGGMLVNKEGEYELAISGLSTPPGTIWFAMANQSPGWRINNTGISVAMNQWHQIVWTYDAENNDGNNLFLYLNGKQIFAQIGEGLITQHTVPDLDPAFSELRIGGRQLERVPSYFDGDISIVKIYPEALTAKEVLNHCKRYEHRFSGFKCKKQKDEKEIIFKRKQ